MPIFPILWDVFEVGVLRKGECRSLHTPAGQTREAIRAVTDRRQVIRNRLDDMIGGNAKVSGAALDHGYNGSQDTAYRSDFLAVRIRHRGHGEEVPEQFVSTVNQVHIHAIPISLLQGML